MAILISAWLRIQKSIKRPDLIACVGRGHVYLQSVKISCQPSDVTKANLRSSGRRFNVTLEEAELESIVFKWISKMSLSFIIGGPCMSPTYMYKWRYPEDQLWVSSAQNGMTTTIVAAV